MDTKYQLNTKYFAEKYRSFINKLTDNINKERDKIIIIDKRKIKKK